MFKSINYFWIYIFNALGLSAIPQDKKNIQKNHKRHKMLKSSIKSLQEKQNRF